MIRLLAALALTLPTLTHAQTMRMAVTTSFQNSGLAETLLPEFELDTGIGVELVVVGTGQALRLGEAGDVDAVLVHSRPDEEAFVEAGHATHRREIMYNDFIIVGPEEDPASVQGSASAADAMARIAESESPFVSRGDDSGTHKAELALWDAAGVEPEGGWYRPVGAGMGAALNTATGMGAYVLSDRASWLNFGNQEGMTIDYEGDPEMYNQYAYLPVNPETHPDVKADLAAQLEDWLVSERARTLIDSYRVMGEQVFFFNAEE